MSDIVVLTDAPNPAVTDGTQETLVHQYIANLQRLWDEQLSAAPVISAWKFWKRPVTVHVVTLFLLECLDYLVQSVDKMALRGAAKKGIVLSVLSALYDSTITTALPVWLKPFSGAVRTLIIYTFLSNTIDFTVKKYHNAIWGSDLPAGAVVFTTNLGQQVLTQPK